MKTKFIKIDDEVAAVLRNHLVYTGNQVQITGERLEPKLYQRVNKVLVQFGGKWTAGKVQAHVFPECPKQAITEAIGAGKVVNHKQTTQFFETPSEVADQLVKMADVQKGQWILEPSAGRGKIVAAIHRAIDTNVYAVELDAGNAAASMKKIFSNLMV